jgi:hypothetical protein
MDESVITSVGVTLPDDGDIVMIKGKPFVVKLLSPTSFSVGPLRGRTRIKYYLKQWWEWLWG